MLVTVEAPRTEKLPAAPNFTIASEGSGGGVRGLVVMVLVSRVTAALRARARPSMVTPVVTVIEVSAMMVPAMEDPVPNVAELPTCQKTGRPGRHWSG